MACVFADGVGVATGAEPWHPASLTRSKRRLIETREQGHELPSSRAAGTVRKPSSRPRWCTPQRENKSEMTGPGHASSSGSLETTPSSFPLGTHGRPVMRRSHRNVIKTHGPRSSPWPSRVRSWKGKHSGGVGAELTLGKASGGPKPTGGKPTTSLPLVARLLRPLNQSSATSPVSCLACPSQGSCRVISRSRRVARHGVSSPPCPSASLSTADVNRVSRSAGRGPLGTASCSGCRSRV